MMGLSERERNDPELGALRHRLRKATGDDEGGKRVGLVAAIEQRTLNLIGRPVRGRPFDKLRGQGCRCPGGKHKKGCPFA